MWAQVVFGALNLWASGINTWQYVTFTPQQGKEKYRLLWPILATINLVSGLYLVLDALLGKGAVIL